MLKAFYALAFLAVFLSCNKKDNTPEPPVTSPAPFNSKSVTVNGQAYISTLYNINFKPQIKIVFTAPVDASTLATNVSVKTMVQM